MTISELIVSCCISRCASSYKCVVCAEVHGTSLDIQLEECLSAYLHVIENTEVWKFMLCIFTSSAPCLSPIKLESNSEVHEIKSYQASVYFAYHPVIPRNLKDTKNLLHMEKCTGPWNILGLWRLLSKDRSISHLSKSTFFICYNTSYLKSIAFQNNAWYFSEIKNWRI